MKKIFLSIISLFLLFSILIQYSTVNASLSNNETGQIIGIDGSTIIDNEANNYIVPDEEPITRVTAPFGMVYVRNGYFPMGCDPAHNGGYECQDSELPLHNVYLDAFFIDKYEVTNAAYKKCVNAGKCPLPQSLASYTRPYYYLLPQYDYYPVIYVTINDARAYCEFVGKRLPTEAEWEKAARGTIIRTYPWGDAVPNSDLANYGGNVGDTTMVGSYPAGKSIYGAMDMAGNVWEMVNDWYSADYYKVSPDANPTGPSSGTQTITRGGDFYYGSGPLRVSFRNPGVNYHGWIDVGFRCATEAAPDSAAPFLRLPYKPSSTDNGFKKVRSWFDHQYPTDDEPDDDNKSIVKFTGQRISYTTSCKLKNACYSNHHGIDYSLTKGTSVLAAAGGTITSGKITCGGRYVSINHGNGYSTVYRHLKDDIYWKKSGTVVQGERIGTVGANEDGLEPSKCWTGPHLHFEVHYDKNDDGRFLMSEVVDPYGWFNQSGTFKTDPWPLMYGGPFSHWLWQFSPPTSVYTAARADLILETTDGITVNIPTDAISLPANIYYNLAPEPDTGIVDFIESADVRVNENTLSTGKTFQLSGIFEDSGEEITSFSLPLTINIDYQDPEVSFLTEDSLGLYWWDEINEMWVLQPSSLDVTNNKLNAQSDKTGVFSLRGSPINFPPTVTNITPSFRLEKEEIGIEITGNNFMDTPSVMLGLGSLVVQYNSSTSLTVFVPASIPAGVYDLYLENPDGQATYIPNAFRIWSSTYLPLIVN